MKITSYIGLGSNLENPIVQVREAIERMREISETTVRKVSKFYCSQPLGPQDQPHFINAVVEIETGLPAEELLNFLQGIETAQKRIRTEKRWGPRTIDLDILLYGREIIHTDRLEIPHPGLLEREFVVYPLAEIAPDLVLFNDKTIADIKSCCPMRGLTMISESEMVS